MVAADCDYAVKGAFATAAGSRIRLVTLSTTNPTCGGSNGRTLVANTGFNLIGLAISSLIALLLTPFLFSRLGSEYYGVWVLCGIVITASYLMDFGLGRALVRQIAQSSGDRERNALNHTFNSLWWPLLVVLVVVLLCGWYLAPLLAETLGATAGTKAVVVDTMRLLFLSVPAVGLGLMLAATLEGAQHMGHSNGALIAARLLFAILAVFALLWGWGVTGVAAAHVISVWLQFLILALAALRVTPALRFRPHLWEGRILKAHMGFGSALLLTGVIALIFSAGNRVILARWVGFEALAYFELAMVIAVQIFTFALMASRALYPALSVAMAQGGVEAVRHLYRRVLRIFVLILAPAALLVIVLAESLVPVWLGSASEATATALQWLVAAWVIAALATAASVGFLVLGKPGLTTTFSTYNALAALLLGILMAPALGLSGVVLANVLAVSTSALLTLAYFGHTIQLDWRAHLSALAPAAALWALVLSILMLALQSLLAKTGLIWLLGFALGYVVLYVLGLFIFGLLNSEEYAWLRRRSALLHLRRNESP